MRLAFCFANGGTRGEVGMLNTIDVERAELGMELGIERVNGCWVAGAVRESTVIPFPVESLIAESDELLVEGRVW